MSPGVVVNRFWGIEMVCQSGVESLDCWRSLQKHACDMSRQWWRKNGIFAVPGLPVSWKAQQREFWSDDLQTGYRSREVSGNWSVPFVRNVVSQRCQRWASSWWNTSRAPGDNVVRQWMTTWLGRRKPTLGHSSPWHDINETKDVESVRDLLCKMHGGTTSHQRATARSTIQLQKMKMSHGSTGALSHKTQKVPMMATPEVQRVRNPMAKQTSSGGTRMGGPGMETAMAMTTTHGGNLDDDGLELLRQIQQNGPAVSCQRFFRISSKDGICSWILDWM